MRLTFPFRFEVNIDMHVSIFPFKLILPGSLSELSLTCNKFF